VDPGAGGSRALLGGGNAIDFDVLVVGVGVVPVTDFLSESGIDVDRGVIVDDLMRSSIPNVWAAGDVAQARDFYDGGKKLNGILPDAVEQGRIAGMAMAGDPGVKAYPGGVPLNTYTFFGHQAVAVGAHGESLAGTQTIRSVDPARNRYLEIVLAGDRLVGIFGIDTPFDPGVMWELILRRIDLGPLRERFIDDPQHAARILMSRTWR